MLASFEVFPLLLHVIVSFEFEVALGVFVAVAYVFGNEVAENHGVDAFALVFGILALLQIT